MWRDQTEYQAKRVRVMNGSAPVSVDGAVAVLSPERSSSWRSKRAWAFGRS
jgi:hypothetical protein